MLITYLIKIVEIITMNYPVILKQCYHLLPQLWLIPLVASALFYLLF